MATSLGRFRLHATLVILLPLGVAAYLWYRETRSYKPHGRFTAAQIVERSQTLCRAMALQTPRRFTPHPDFRWDRDGIYRACWRVEYADEANNPQGEFVWDAQTGALRVAKRFQPPSDRREARRNRQEAIRASWVWMRSLGIAEQGVGWRLVRTLPPASEWRVDWESARRGASVFVDVRSGALRSAESWPLPTGGVRR